MEHRELPEPGRCRRVPEHFSWVDHRLVRDGHVGRCGPPALALYLVLITVADAEGVSYYGERTLCRMLHWTPLELKGARRQLQQVGLIAWREPFYQVLDLAPEPVTPAPAATLAVATAPTSVPEGPATPAQVAAMIDEWRRRNGTR